MEQVQGAYHMVGQLQGTPMSVVWTLIIMYSVAQQGHERAEKHILVIMSSPMHPIEKWRTWLECWRFWASFEPQNATTYYVQKNWRGNPSAHGPWRGLIMLLRKQKRWIKMRNRLLNRSGVVSGPIIMYNNFCDDIVTFTLHNRLYSLLQVSERDAVCAHRFKIVSGCFLWPFWYRLLCTKKSTRKPICSWSLTRSYNAPTKTKTVNEDAESSPEPIWRGFETDYYVQYFLRRHCHFCLTKLALQLAKNVWEVSRLCTSIGNRV